MKTCCLVLLLLAFPTAARAADVRVHLAGESRDDLVEVLALAKSAERRLWVFAYTLSDAGLIDVLTEKAAAPDFDLRILVDGEQFKKTQAQLGPLKSKLTRIDVPDEGRLHTKLMLIDEHTIVLGSKNWSDLANQAKWNDVLVVRNDKKLVAQVEQAFASVGEFKTASRHAASAPEDSQAEPAKVSLHFSAPGKPGARTRDLLLALVNKAKKRIYISMFVFSDPELVKAVWLKRLRRVEIKVVLDAVQFANLDRRTDRLSKVLQGCFHDLGESVRLSSGKQLHHKLAVIDDVVVTGSANWTQAAWERNHEVVAVVRPERSKDAPRFVETYLGRIEALWEKAK